MHSLAPIALAVTLALVPVDPTPPTPPTRPAADIDCPPMVELAASLRQAGLTAQAAKNAALTIRQDCRVAQRPGLGSAPSASP
jgi:hypothetical protein